MAALPCWLIMPPDFGWCNLHIIHFWLVKSRINKDHRAIGQALRQVCEALRQQPALQHVLVGVHSSQRWEEQGKGGWEADIHVQICSDMFDTFLYISHDVYWCSTLLTYFTNHWVWNGSKYSELPKNGQDALRSWDSEQQRLLGGDGRRGDNEWLPMNLLVGSFVGSFVGLQLLPVNICQQNSFRDWRTWRGEQGTRTGWMPPKCRSHAGRLPSEMLHGVHLGHLWPSVWVRKAQQIGNHLESHGVTIKNSDIYIYIHIYIWIYCDLNSYWPLGSSWTAVTLSLYNYIYCTWRLFGGWCDFRDTLWPCSDVTFTDLMWLSRADMLGPAAKWSWWVLERSLQHGHPLVEGNVWKCCDRIKGRVQPIRVISGN